MWLEAKEETAGGEAICKKTSKINMIVGVGWGLSRSLKLDIINMLYFFVRFQKKSKVRYCIKAQKS